jgi:putative hydroxymethylpyrimidine transport system substrate-binding protein
MVESPAGEERLQMRSVVAALTAFVLVVTAAGCGEKQEHRAGDSEPLTLELDFYVNPDHAGIYEALARGYFDEAGLEVQPRVPSDPSAPIRQVAAGRADLAISYEPEVLLAQDQGLPVTAVAALVPRPLTSLISLPEAGIHDVADLRGKTIATAGIPYQADYLEAILGREGLSPDDVSQKDVGFNLLPAVLSGSADAMLGGFLNVEGVDLAERGLHPSVVPVDRLGVPTYDELVLVADSDRVANDPQAIRLFIAALERGTRAAVKDPAGATEAILAAGDGLEPRLTRAEIDRTLPLLLPEKPSQPFGYMNGREWEAFAGFFADHGLISTRPSADEMFTDELLPGRIP